MKKPLYTNQIVKDVRRLQKRGCDMEKYKEIARLLCAGSPLPARCRPHALVGKYSGFMECHIAPDWLLIYQETEDAISFQRMGTHSDLF